MGSGSSKNLTASAIGKGLTMSAVLAAGSPDNVVCTSSKNNNNNNNAYDTNRVHICNDESIENDESTANSINEKRTNLADLLASKPHAKGFINKDAKSGCTSQKNTSEKSAASKGLSPGAAAALQVADSNEENTQKPIHHTPETNMPIPLRKSRDTQISENANDKGNVANTDDGNYNENGNYNSKVSFVSLNDLFGSEGCDAKYIKRQSIGKGAFGEAYIVERNIRYNPSRHPAIEVQVKQNKLAHETKPEMLYVAKIMDLHSMPTRDRHYAQTEIFCLAHTNHFAIIKYYEHYILDSDDEILVIIMEFADHGDLNRNLNHGSIVSVDKTTGREIVAKLQLYEREAGTYFVQLLLALHHIHSHRMMHRDIKSANVFLTSIGIIKLGDFGFSQKYESTVSSESVAGTFLGTPYYLSPEMWQGMRYGKKADIWAAGIILYEMLMDGRRPFEARTLPELRDRVLNMEIVLPNEPPELVVATTDNLGVNDDQSKRPSRGNFSAEMRDLVKSTLQRDPSKRPSAEELLRTPIMQHYLCLFEKHVHSLISADDAVRAKTPECNIAMLNLPDDNERELIMNCIAEAKALVAKAIEKGIVDSSVPRYEGVVYKDNRNNIWKERYLILADNVLTISLSKGKEAASGTERSKRVSLKMIKSVSPCEPNDVVTATTSSLSLQSKMTSSSITTTTTSESLSLQHAPSPPASAFTNISKNAVNSSNDMNASSSAFTPKYAFAVAMESSNSIIFGVKTVEDVDNWLNALLRALEMN